VNNPGVEGELGAIQDATSKISGPFMTRMSWEYS
jgi:hypothetical protein